jgi:hypothetical protein
VLDHAVAPTKVLRQVDANPALLEGDPQAPSPATSSSAVRSPFQDRDRKGHEEFRPFGGPTLAERPARIRHPRSTVHRLRSSRSRAPSVVTEHKTARRKPRLRHRIRCLLLGHTPRQTNLTGYASRCRRCRMLWRSPARPGHLSAGDLGD